MTRIGEIEFGGYRTGHRNFQFSIVSPELCGSATQGGYAELAAYDSNGDGRISVGDLIRSELQIWQDYDRDGVTDAGKVSVPKSLARGANDNEQDAWRAAAFHFDGWEMAA